MAETAGKLAHIVSCEACVRLELRTEDGESATVLLRPNELDAFARQLDQAAAECDKLRRERPILAGKN